MQMHLDPIMPVLTGVGFAMLLMGLLMRRMRQPFVIGYLIAGVLVGPYGWGLLTDEVLLNRMGALGVLFLLFFVGMEISLPKLLEQWWVLTVGTAAQIGLSVLAAFIIGQWLGWPTARSLFLGFVISLSSTAVVIKILETYGELDSPIGRHVLGILLAQDLALVPMVIVLSLFSGEKIDVTSLAKQVVGFIGLAAVLIYVARKKTIVLPLGGLQKDRELQVFVGLVVCLGVASLTGAFELSAPLGAFVAGILLSAGKETEWVHERLEPFRVVFVALFFVSVGMTLDVGAFWAKGGVVATLVVVALVSNTGINTLVLRFMGESWRTSGYGGAMLAQIGEFSFVLAALGRQQGLVNDDGYQLAMSVIFFTLLLGPLWVLPFRPKPAT